MERTLRRDVTPNKLLPCWDLCTLAASLFLYYYAKYFMTDIGNKSLAIYDNLDFVNKLSWLLEDDYNSHGIHKATAQEVLKLILQIIPNDFAIEHKDLSTKARLNIDADKIATSNSSMPLNHHIQSTKFVIYDNKQYAQHRIDYHIRIDSHANQKIIIIMREILLDFNNI